MRNIFFILILLSFSVHSHDKIYVGQFTYGHEVSVFKECNSDKLYWLQASGFLMQPVQDTALAMDKPYTPIYLTFRGHEIFEQADGFQADYDYQMHLSEVISFSASIPTACQ